MASTVESTISDAPAVERIPTSCIVRAGLISAVVAAVANVVLFWILGAGGVPFLMPLQGPGGPLEPLPTLSIVIFTVVPAILATGLFWALNLVTQRPVPKFIGVSVVLLLLSFVPNIMLPVATATIVSLSLMHVVAAVVIVGGMVLLTRDE